jgi:predicted phosphate transport protein (TIGR00153 family)
MDKREDQDGQEEERSAARQYGVLAWKKAADGRPLVLLITSRQTGRWVVPRGNPMRGLTGHESAAVEAWEEAGIRGALSELPIGTYRYDKVKRSGRAAPTDVTLYAMEVSKELFAWPERPERHRSWFPLDEAAGLVAEPRLAEIVARFDPDRVTMQTETSAPLSQKCNGTRARLLAALARGSSMLNLFQKLMPKEERFFDLFERHAATLVGGADALVRLTGGTDIENNVNEIRDFENQADDVTRDVLVAVRRSFITPFDRSAITALVSSMDDAIDEMWQTAKAVTLYEVRSFEPFVEEMSRLAAEAARLVQEALPLMRNIGRNGARLHELTEAIVHLEGRADDLHQQGLKRLFQAHGADRTMDFIVGREIYSHVERVLDRLEDVADEIQGIVIDHA